MPRGIDTVWLDVSRTRVLISHADLVLIADSAWDETVSMFVLSSKIQVGRVTPL